MPKIIVTAETIDLEEWESHFRKRSDIFRKQTITNVEYTISPEEKRIYILFEVQDVHTYKEVLFSPETQEVLLEDSIKPETVQVFVLDRSIIL